MLLPEKELAEIRNSLTCDFQIGDMVTPKHIGTLWAGKISGIIPFNTYASYRPNAMQFIYGWTQIYQKLGLDFPNVSNTCMFVAYVFIEPAVQPLSFAEFKDSPKNNDIPDNELEILYKNTIEYVNFLLHPIIDLEKIE